ncbi:hypothetical protein ACFE04_019240 [Oxalis oulophora]
MTKFKNQDELPTLCTHSRVEDREKENFLRVNISGVNVYSGDDQECVTPPAEENRIPKTLVCPPAPRRKHKRKFFSRLTSSLECSKKNDAALLEINQESGNIVWMRRLKRRLEFSE